MKEKRHGEHYGKRRGDEETGPVNTAGNARILLGSLLVLCLLGAMPADKTTLSEYRIKVALIYKLLQFTEWPPPPAQEVPDTGGKRADAKDEKEVKAPPEPFRIGICGLEKDTALLKLFLPLERKNMGTRPLQIVRIEARELERKTPEILKKLDVLYLPRSLKKKTVEHVLRSVKDKSVLTFGEEEGFLELGGDIRFLREGNHIRFEINLAAAKASGLKIKTSVLKLAKRVIQKEKPKNS